MKIHRLFFFLLGLTGLANALCAATRTLDITAPTSAYPGQPMSISVSANTQVNGEHIHFLWWSYSVDGGDQWTDINLDQTSGTPVSRSATIFAGGLGSTTIIRAQAAYRTPATANAPEINLDYNGVAIDWSGTWNNWGTPPSKYFYIPVNGVNSGAVIIPNTTYAPANNNQYAVVAGATTIATGTTTLGNTVVVSSGATVTYQASGGVDLKQGFRVASGGKFFALYDPFLDSDGDGMTNLWERSNGLDPNSKSDALGDFDADGLTNAAEFNLSKPPGSYNKLVTTNSGSTSPSNWPNIDSSATSSYAIGATTGSLQVDKNGAATYSVPLWVTPGTAGMEPKLSLNYSSQAGAGWLGYGWSLSGISAITRGPQTLAIDGRIQGISYTDSDQFYLDGQRLIYVGEGFYGSEYRTEIDSISRIVRFGTASGGTGPAYFKVWTKAGLIVELGNTADSKALAQGRAEIATWAVNKISDTAGNYMNFTYAINNSIGEQKLSQIDYTGNGSVSTYASVRFAYEARSDTFSGYVAGCKVSRTQRLKSIGVYYDTSLVRNYVLDYIERPNTGRSILTTLHEKADDSEFNPLVFDYETPAPAGWSTPNSATWAAPASLFAQGGTPRGVGFVDLNGDGRPDFVQYRTNSNGTLAARNAWLNTVNGWAVADGSNAGTGNIDYRIPITASVPAGSPVSLAQDSTADTGTRLIDIDGDGLVDVFRIDGSVFRNSGSGFVASSTQSIPLPSHSPTYTSAKYTRPTFIDLDGDGRVDFAASATYVRSTEARIQRTSRF